MDNNKWLNLANKLIPYRKLLLLLVALFASLVIYSFVCLEPSQQNKFALPNFLALLWSLLLYLLLTLIQNSSQISSEKMSMIARVKRKMYRGLYLAFSVVFIGLTGAIFWVTFRLLSVI